jgi:hypothetical protein
MSERVVSLFDVDDVTEFGHVRDYHTTRVLAADVREFCRRWHYTHTGGSTMWNYGIWDGMTLLGCVSYNLPTMRACGCVFGPDRWREVAHMGRLVCADEAPRNTESRLIAGSLRLLKDDKPELRAILTYAAMDAGHVGYVYQATNALYTGLGGYSTYFIDPSGNRRGTFLSGMVTSARAANLGWTKKAGMAKHRYVYLLGTRTERRQARADLLLPVLPYPKAPQAF